MITISILIISIYTLFLNSYFDIISEYRYEPLHKKKNSPSWTNTHIEIFSKESEFIKMISKNECPFSLICAFGILVYNI